MRWTTEERRTAGVSPRLGAIVGSPLSRRRVLGLIAVTLVAPAGCTTPILEDPSPGQSDVAQQGSSKGAPQPPPQNPGSSAGAGDPKQGPGTGTPWMRLTNSFLGDGRSLEVTADGNPSPFMGETNDSGGQFWKLVAMGQNTYRIENMLLGDGKSLDTYSDGNNDPFMGITGNYGGQFWKLTPQAGGYYRLTNAFLGDGRSLDTYNGGGNLPFMDTTGNFSGQLWKLTPIH